MEKSWRDSIKVHPAADIFPMLPEEELLKLGEDIKKNGLKEGIAVWHLGGEPYVLDGRNRLAAMELVGLKANLDWPKYGWYPQLEYLPNETDPATYVISKNIHRRHLTKEQQADLIVKVTQAGTDFAKLARSVKRDSSGHVRGSVKDPIKEKVVKEAKKQGISERTAERALAKSRGPTLTRRESKPAAASATDVVEEARRRNSYSVPMGIGRLEAAIANELNLLTRYSENNQQYLEIGRWLEQRTEQWLTVRTMSTCGNITTEYLGRETNSPLRTSQTKES